MCLASRVILSKQSAQSARGSVINFSRLGRQVYNLSYSQRNRTRASPTTTPRLQHPVSHRRRHLTRPARDTPGRTRSEPTQCGVTPNDAGLPPPLVPENLSATTFCAPRPHLLQTAGRPSQLAHLRDHLDHCLTAARMDLPFSVGWTAETGHQNTYPCLRVPHNQGAVFPSSRWRYASQRSVSVAPGPFIHHHPRP